MPDVRMPDGTIVRNVPEGTTRAQLQARLGKAYKPESRLGKLFTQGITAGLSDEIMGGAGVIANAVAAPFSSKVNFEPSKAYRRWRDMERADIAETRKANPWVGGALELAGGIVNPIGAAKKASTLAQTVKAGMKSGALQGALAGFGYGEGSNSVNGAALGGAAGGVLGGAVPVASRLISRPVQAARDFLNPNNGLGRQLVARALQDQGTSPRLAAQALQEGQSRGVPMMLADSGEATRALLSSAARKSPAARAMVKATVLPRQEQQAERLRSAISRDLGPIMDPNKVSEQLMTQARAQAAPLYEKAYAAPGMASEEIDALLATPAGKAALAKAHTIAANERVDPKKLGFDLNDQGEVVLTRVPTPQTLDYVKRGLDDVIESARDPMTRQVAYTPQLRSVEAVRSQLVKEADRINPAYREARQAFAGPASANEAMQIGQKSIGKSAQEIEQITARMSEADLSQFALGYRAAMADTIDRRVIGADKVGALLGSPRKQKALSRVFGGEQGLDNFAKTMVDESAANETYRAVNSGSQTAERMADDAHLEDGALIMDLGGKAMSGALNGGTAGAIANVIQGLKDTAKFGAGKAGERARQDAATLLSQTDIAALAKAMREASKANARKRILDRKVLSSSQRLGGLIGRGVGSIAGVATRPPSLVGDDDFLRR